MPAFEANEAFKPSRHVLPRFAEIPRSDLLSGRKPDVRQKKWWNEPGVLTKERFDPLHRYATIPVKHRKTPNLVLDYALAPLDSSHRLRSSNRCRPTSLRGLLCYPVGLYETSPQLRRVVILHRGSYGDGKAIHHGHGGHEDRLQRRFGTPVAQHAPWHRGCDRNRGVCDLCAGFCARRFRSTGP